MNALLNVVSEALATDSSSLSDDVAFRDLETWDSLKHMSLVLALEESFGIRLSQEEIAGSTSLGSLRTILRNRGIQ